MILSKSGNEVIRLFAYKRNNNDGWIMIFHSEPASEV
jgi:hypothetical protein